MRLLPALAGLTLGTALLTAGLSAPAQAQPAGATEVAAVLCGNVYWPHANLDPSGGKTTTNAAVHTGPYGDCTTTFRIPAGTSVSYDCYVVNDYGNTWTYVRAPGGSGWVYDSYLDDGGSFYRC